jgi:hypothetical protein
MSESTKQQYGTSNCSTVSIMSHLNDETEAEIETTTTTTTTSSLHDEDDNDGSGDDIDSIAIDNTNGVKMKDDDLETGCSGDGVAIVEESLSLLLSVVADDIDDNNKKQNNKNKDIK